MVCEHCHRSIEKEYTYYIANYTCQCGCGSIVLENASRHWIEHHLLERVCRNKDNGAEPNDTR